MTHLRNMYKFVFMNYYCLAIKCVPGIEPRLTLEQTENFGFLILIIKEKRWMQGEIEKVVAMEFKRQQRSFVE